MEKQRKEEKVHQFLIGLNDALYGSVRSNIIFLQLIPYLI
jgi:hypothetical protein